jgi:hypothetical protein
MAAGRQELGHPADFGGHGGRTRDHYGQRRGWRLLASQA